MKTLYRYLALALLIVLNTSCLKSGLDELETYDQNDITNIRFEYRWWDEAAQRLRVIEMGVTKTIDTKAKKIECSIKVPEVTSAFTAGVRNQVSLSTLSINVDVSTAARISPVGDAPAMGTFPAGVSSISGAAGAGCVRLMARPLPAPISMTPRSASFKSEAKRS